MIKSDQVANGSTTHQSTAGSDVTKINAATQLESTENKENQQSAKVIIPQLKMPLIKQQSSPRNESKMSTLHEANENEEIGQTPEQHLEAAGAPASLYSDEEKKVQVQRSGQSKGLVPPVKVSDIVLDFDEPAENNAPGSSLCRIEEGQRTKRRSVLQQSHVKTKLKQLKKLEKVMAQQADDYQVIQRDLQMLHAILKSGAAATSLRDNRTRASNAPGNFNQMTAHGPLQGYVGYGPYGSGGYSQMGPAPPAWASRQEQRFSPLDVSAQQQTAPRSNLFFSCTPYSNRQPVHQHPLNHAASGNLHINTASSNCLLSHRSKSKEESASTLPNLRKLETCDCPKAKPQRQVSGENKDVAALLCEDCCCVVCDDMKNSQCTNSLEEIDEVGIDRDNSLEKNCLSQDAIQKLKIGGQQSTSSKQLSCQVPSKVIKQRGGAKANAMSLILQGKQNFSGKTNGRVILQTQRQSCMHYPTNGGANASTTIAGYNGLEVLKSHRSNLSQHRQSSQNSRGNKGQAKQFSGGGGIELTLRRQPASKIEAHEDLHHNGGDESVNTVLGLAVNQKQGVKSACNFMNKDYKSQEFKNRVMSTEARVGVQQSRAKLLSDMNATVENMLEEQKMAGGDRDCDSKQVDILQGLQQSELGQPINIGLLFNNSSSAAGQFTNQLGSGVNSRSPPKEKRDGKIESRKNSATRSNQPGGLLGGTTSGLTRCTRKQGLGGRFGQSVEGLASSSQMFNMKQTTHTPPLQNIDTYQPKTLTLSHYQATTSATNMTGKQLTSQSQAQLHSNQTVSNAQLYQQSSHSQSQPRLNGVQLSATNGVAPFTAQSPPMRNAAQTPSFFEAAGIIRTALAKVEQMQLNVAMVLKTQLTQLNKTRSKIVKRKRQPTTDKSAGGLTQRQATARGPLTSRLDDESGSISYRTKLDNIGAVNTMPLSMNHPAQLYYYGLAPPPPLQQLHEPMYVHYAPNPYQQLSPTDCHHQMMFDQHHIGSLGWAPDEEDAANEAPFMTINNETSADNNKSSCLMLTSSTGIGGQRMQTRRTEAQAATSLPMLTQQNAVPAKEPFQSQNIIVLPTNTDAEMPPHQNAIQIGGVDQNIFYRVGSGNSTRASRVQRELSFNNSSSATFLNNTDDKHMLSTSPGADKVDSLAPPMIASSSKHSKIDEKTPSLNPQANHGSGQAAVKVVTSSAFKSRNRRTTAKSHDKLEVLAAQSQKKRKQLSKFYEQLDRISPVLSSYPSQKKESSQKATLGINDSSGVANGEEEGDLDDEERQQLILMTHTFEDILQAKMRHENKLRQVDEAGAPDTMNTATTPTNFAQMRVHQVARREEDESKKQRGRRVSNVVNKKQACSSGHKKKASGAPRGFQIPKLNLNKVLGSGAVLNSSKAPATSAPGLTLVSDAATSPVHALMTAQANVSDTVDLNMIRTASKERRSDAAAKSTQKTKSHRKVNHHTSKSLSSAKLYSPQQQSRDQSPNKAPMQVMMPHQANSVSFVVSAPSGDQPAGELQTQLGRQHLKTIEFSATGDDLPGSVEQLSASQMQPAAPTIRLHKQQKMAGPPPCPATQRQLLNQMASLLKLQMRQSNEGLPRLDSATTVSKKKIMTSQKRGDNESLGTARSGHGKGTESQGVKAQNGKKRLPVHHANNMMTTILNTARMSSQSSRSRKSGGNTAHAVTEQSARGKPKLTKSRFNQNILISCQGHDTNSVAKNVAPQATDALRNNIVVITPRVQSQRPHAGAPSSATPSAAKKFVNILNRKKQENSVEKLVMVEGAQKLATSKPASIKRRHFETAVNEKTSYLQSQAGIGENATLESQQRKRKVALLDLSGVAGSSSAACNSMAPTGTQPETLTKDLKNLNRQLMQQQQKLNVNSLQSCAVAMNHPQTCKNNDNFKLAGLFGKNGGVGGGGATPRNGTGTTTVNAVVSSARVSQERKVKRIPSGARRNEPRHLLPSASNCAQIPLKSQVISPTSALQHSSTQVNKRGLGTTSHETSQKEQQKTLSPQRKSVEKSRKSENKNILNIKVKKESFGVAKIKQVAANSNANQIVGKKIQVKLKTGQPCAKFKQVQTARAGTNDLKSKMLFSAFMKDLNVSGKNNQLTSHQVSAQGNTVFGFNTGLSLDVGSTAMATGATLGSPQQLQLTSEAIASTAEESSIKHFQTTTNSRKGKQ